MYLNAKKISNIRLAYMSAFFWIIPTCVFDILVAGINLIAFVVTLPQFAVVNLVSSLVFALILTAKIFLFIFMIRIWKRNTRARRYADVFNEDHDGVITYASIANLTGYPEDTVRTDLRDLVSKNYLKNIRLYKDRAEVIAVEGANELFVLLCPTCGADVSIRRGMGATCEHCGTFFTMEG